MSLEARDDKTFNVDVLRRLKRAQISMVLRVRRIWRAIGSRFSSSLTRASSFSTSAGLSHSPLAFLYLNQFREGLIDARVQSLQTQGEIIRQPLLRLRQLKPIRSPSIPKSYCSWRLGKANGVSDESQPSLEFSINPERVGPVLRRLVSPTRRARASMTATAICCSIRVR